MRSSRLSLVRMLCAIFAWKNCLIMVSSSTTSSWIMIKLHVYEYVMRLEDELSDFEGYLSLYKQGKTLLS